MCQSCTDVMCHNLFDFMSTKAYIIALQCKFLWLMCGECEKSFALAVASQGGGRGAGGFPLTGAIVKPAPTKGAIAFSHFR